MADVLSSLMSAAATLASLNLVFLGIVSTAYAHDQQREHSRGARHYRRLGVVALVTFVVGIADVAVTALALLDVDAQGILEPVAVVGFFVQLAALVGLAAYAVRALI